MRTLKTQDVRRLRLANLHLSPRCAGSARDVVAHLGALQAQEFWSGVWSIGARSSAVDVESVYDAIGDGSIVRTWPLRNTVHFIPTDAARWMLSVARTFAFKGVERRREHLGLTEQAALDACELLAGALSQPVSRSGCIELLTESGLMTQSSHAYHLLWFAAVNAAIVMGPQRGSDQSFVAFDAWVPSGGDRSFDDALAELACRYFSAHGPAPLTELRRWTGLTMAQTRRAVSLAADRLAEVPTEAGPMLMATDQVEALGTTGVDQAEPDRSVLLLSGFDEYILGYGDRSAIMEPDRFALVVPGNNGVFRPTIVDDGTVVGVWRRKVTKTRVDVSVEPFGSLTARQNRGIQRAADEYGAFLGIEARVVEST